jgi:uncharacterized SAM-binding protein YcdF (DUF218 family)
MFLFWLKKFVSFWLMPLSLCLTLLVAGWWVSRDAKRARAGRALMGAGTLLLLIFGHKVVSTWLVRPIEYRYPAIPEFAVGAPPAALAACRYVVVLGSGHSDTPGLSANNQLSPAALGRIVEALRLLRALPEARLIVTGPAYRDHPSHAAVLAKVATTFGFDPARIIQLPDGRDTEEEAAFVRATVGDAPVALVTSAAHLPRATGLFRKQGITTLPCPANFTARPNPEWRGPELDWDIDSLERSTWAVRERIGYFWVWLRGKA